MRFGGKKNLDGRILRKNKSRSALSKEEAAQLQARIDAMPTGLDRGKTPQPKR